jgi:glycosyltransferase involved in cell wall biosynthesis
MRILLVGNHWTDGPGGAETVAVLSARLLERAGHEVVPFAVDQPEALPATSRDRFPRPAGAGARTKLGEAAAGVWSWRAYASLRRLVADVRPDVAHVHHVFERLTLSVLDALRRSGVPTVMTLHDYKPVCPGFRLHSGDGEPCGCLEGRYGDVVRHRCLEGSWWRGLAAAVDARAARARGVWRGVAAFLAPSAYLRDRVVEGGLPADRVSVLPNPVELPARSRRHDNNQPYVLVAGRLVAEKGVATVLDASALLPAGARVRLVGSGRLQRWVRDAVARRTLPVDVLGGTDPKGVSAHLRGATAALVPSLWPENCPMAVLEAAAHGVPVVASAVGGIPELVDHGRTGLLVPPGDAPALAAAVTALLADPGAAERMGAAGRERARRRHGPGDHVDALLATYAAVAASASAPPVPDLAR